MQVVLPSTVTAGVQVWRRVGPETAGDRSCSPLQDQPRGPCVPAVGMGLRLRLPPRQAHACAGWRCPHRRSCGGCFFKDLVYFF